MAFLFRLVKLGSTVCADCNSSVFTFLAVGFALLHVEGLVPDGSLAGRTLETLNVVGHLQGMHDFLIKGERYCKYFIFSFGGVAEVQRRLHSYILVQRNQTAALFEYKMSLLVKKILPCFWFVFWICSKQRCSSYPRDHLFALGAVRSISVIVALGTVDRPSLLEEAPLFQDRLAL